MSPWAIDLCLGEGMASHWGPVSRLLVPDVKSITDVLDVPEYCPPVLQWSAVRKEGNPGRVYLTAGCVCEPCCEVAV